MSDWANQFKTFNDSVGNAAKNVFNMIDQFTFKMLVDNLKSEDYDAVAEAINQIVSEKKPLGIPPLYFVSQAHPNMRCRKKAQDALKELGKDEEIERLTRGKSVEEATKILIDTYGNYRKK